MARRYSGKSVDFVDTKKLPSGEPNGRRNFCFGIDLGKLPGFVVVQLVLAEKAERNALRTS